MTTTALPTRERGYSSLNNLMPVMGYAGGEMDSGSNNDMSVTSPEGPSNRPTPNSSIAASEHRQAYVSGAPSQPHTTGRGSFDASPVSPQQKLGLAGPLGGVPGGNDNVAAFFNDPSAFGIPAGLSTGMTPDQMFSMADGSAAGGPGQEYGVGPPPPWATDLSGQAGMTPVTEGMLRTMMAMGPMDSMDLGWEGNP
jgi:hypothetical protein